jgi:hypothetical protein
MFTTIIYERQSLSSCLYNPNIHSCKLYDSTRCLSLYRTSDHETLLQRVVDVGATRMEWTNVQQQSDSSSCGPYVIVYAVDIAYDIDSTRVNYIEQEMKKHFLFCLDRDMLKPFPRHVGIDIEM